MARAASGMGKELRCLQMFKSSLLDATLLFLCVCLSPTRELPGAADERCFGIWSFALSVPGGHKRLQKQNLTDTESMFLLSASAEALFEP